MDRVIYPEEKSKNNEKDDNDDLTGIFFCAMAITQSVPRIATVVKPP